MGAPIFDGSVAADNRSARRTKTQTTDDNKEDSIENWLTNSLCWNSDCDVVGGVDHCDELEIVGTRVNPAVTFLYQPSSDKWNREAATMKTVTEFLNTSPVTSLIYWDLFPHIDELFITLGAGDSGYGTRSWHLPVYSVTCLDPMDQALSTSRTRERASN